MRPVRGLALFALVALFGCGDSAFLRGYEESVAKDLARLRDATRRFRKIDSAFVVGYAKDVPACLVHESHGAMGFHHSNRGYADATLDIEKPEILLYERLPNGHNQLNGVEFIVPYSAWSKDSIAPMIMGQHLKREDNLNIWYLHVWAWKKNSDGLFADFHPLVQCPAENRRVFKPFVG